MSCQVCGSKNAAPTVRDITYTFQGSATTILSVSGEFCDDCGEFVLAKSESERVATEMLDFNKKCSG
jgi:YgiT-type zinc finger domain-containing protein